MMAQSGADIGEFFKGVRLYGDDFNADELKRWYAEEEYGYYDLRTAMHGQGDEQTYGYHGLNWWYAYSFLQGRSFDHCVGLGSSNADDVAARSTGEAIYNCRTCRKLLAREHRGQAGNLCEAGCVRYITAAFRILLISSHRSACCTTSPTFPPS